MSPASGNWWWTEVFTERQGKYSTLAIAFYEMAGSSQSYNYISSQQVPDTLSYLIAFLRRAANATGKITEFANKISK